MKQRYLFLALIVVLFAVSLWIDLPGTHFGISSFDTVFGLDLRGGTQVLMEVPEGVTVTTQSLEDARQILENRSNGILGTTESSWQVAGERRIVGEMPGVTDPDKQLASIKQTGVLEFVDVGTDVVQVGQILTTDYASTSNTDTQSTATAEPTAAATAKPTATETETAKIYHTIMTGSQLNTVGVSTDELGAYEINFVLKSEGTAIFSQYTTNNVGKTLAIVLDSKVISAPSISVPITEGKGRITGNFSYDTANALAIQLRYGALPIPLNIVETRVVGPTLGQDSLNKSIVAGLIGFAVVALFMLIYYRLPGFVAILSIGTYALITLAIFKLIPVTLTLPGIAGFLLSTGGALDANILIFERLKEELRAGRNLTNAVDLGWKRAWSSIRDSNLATLITSIILFWFGSSFGATIVKGFAVTLALGVVVSLFCALVVTRTLLNITIDLFKTPSAHLKWFGL